MWEPTQTSAAAFVCLGMVKSTCEGEKLRVRGGPRLASPTGTRPREEEQVGSQTCSPGSMEGDTSVDPTERPNSKFMVPPQQPALILVAPAIAPEDPDRKGPNFPAAPVRRSKLRT